MTEDEAPAIIEQSDREMAASLLTWHDGTVTMASADILAGLYDDEEIVRLFAKHRLTAASQAREEALENAASLVAAYAAQGTAQIAHRSLATDIRNLKGKP